VAENQRISAAETSGLTGGAIIYSGFFGLFWFIPGSSLLREEKEWYFFFPTIYFPRKKGDRNHMHCFSGHIQNFDIFVAVDQVTVISETGVVAEQPVSGISRFVHEAKDLTLGFAAFADFAVIYLYDKAAHCFGYAVNLQDPNLSQWGDAPFHNNAPE
jgi:hypothetical protein